MSLDALNLRFMTVDTFAQKDSRVQEKERESEKILRAAQQIITKLHSVSNAQENSVKLFFIVIFQLK